MGSEQISERWLSGAKRECSKCGVKITNLAKQIAEVRHVYPGPRTQIICMECKRKAVERMIEDERAYLETRRARQRP